ncbi:MAG: type II toxin-antitoxin system HicB family antitoxin [bacterium]|nr:type II toxin-antitoxin system HicB family antitoxin [bacterium]MDZ4232064.1 type II toxin-antitoxin system HicB family antitoxin [Candidatus Pacearchaeota archaeon]
MKQQFTATYKKHGKWYLGWVEEIPGVNTQGKTLKEVRENLKEALSLMLEVNRALAGKEIPGKTLLRESLMVTSR